MSTIEVCQAGACRAAGSEAVQLEIEELANMQCLVEPSGCLGACSQAPNAVLVLEDGTGVLQTGLSCVEKSAAVVAKATGSAPNLDDPALMQRLAAARNMRKRKEAVHEQKWNAALDGMVEQVASASEEDRPELEFELAELLASAGQWERALSHFNAVRAVSDHPQLLMSLGDVLAKLGRVEALEVLQTEGDHVRGHYRYRAEVDRFLTRCRADATKAQAAGAAQQRKIEGYAQWTLTAKTPVSAHSATFHFTCTDPKRGTPYLRGRGRTMWHKTWHTTMLAEVGANTEGPLGYIERDYTPVSTWMAWEKGECAILIKVYRDGAATSWYTVGGPSYDRFGPSAKLSSQADGGRSPRRLHRQPLGGRVWLSQPQKTMHVPTLTLDVGPSVPSAALRHGGVLLVLGGTGIVSAAQVLQHADPTTCFGTSAHRQPPLTAPISLVYSCRRDDALMIGELAEWSAAATRRAEAKKRAPSGPGDVAFLIEAAILKKAGTAGLNRCMLAVSSPPQTGELEAAAHHGLESFQTAYAPAALRRQLEAATPFAADATPPADLAALAALPNVSLVEHRVTRELLQAELAHLQGGASPPCRVVVSGPAGFNGAVKAMLGQCGVDKDMITVLSA
jgi:hypothetical protein